MLQKSLRLSLYFFLGFILSAVVTLSYAETIPATPTVSTTIPKLWNVSGHMAKTKEAACSLWSRGAVYNGLNNGYGYGQCTKFGWDPVNIGVGNCPSGTTSNAEMTCTGTIYTCEAGKNWTLSGQTCTRPDCVSPQVLQTDGTCKVPVPVCEGAQFLDEAQNKCVCSYQDSSTKSYQVSFANAKAGNLKPPTCSNGCTQVYTGHVITCPGALVTMVVGGSTTCYASTFQSGAICSGSGGGGAAPPVEVTLAPITAPPADPGTNPSGAQDPLSTTPNNSDPSTCASSGGNWGVFNGKGSCYTPTPNDPKMTQEVAESVVKDNATGETSTTQQTTTEVCTGAGACTSTTITNVSGSGGSTTTTTTGKGGSGSGNVTSTGNGNYKIDLPTDYQRDSTGLTLNKKVDDLLTVIGKPVSDDQSIRDATNSEASAKAITDLDKRLVDTINGAEDSSIQTHVQSWKDVASTWYAPISISGCAPFISSIGPWTWEFDHCEKAAQISEWGGYCAWIGLMFYAFRLLTTPRPVG